MKTLRRLWKREEGIETMEFALIGGLVAVAAIAGMTLLGGNLQLAFAALAASVAP